MSEFLREFGLWMFLISLTALLGILSLARCLQAMRDERRR